MQYKSGDVLKALKVRRPDVDWKQGVSRTERRFAIIKLLIND